jgi:hypothetical protein
MRNDLARRLLPALLVLSLCLGCQSEAEAPGPPRDPDLYQSPALGISIRKPHDWVFLTETSYPSPGSSTERLDDDALVALLSEPEQVLAVAFARHPEPYPGINPTARVLALSLDAPPFIQDLYPPSVTMQTNIRRKQALPGFEILEEISSEKLSGLDGATVRLGYQMSDSSGRAQPVVERLFHAQRGRIFFYLEMVAPAEGPEETEDEFARIRDSFGIDP